MSKINRVSKKKQAEKRIEDEIRSKLLEEHGGLCQLCKQRPDFRGLSLHHIHYKSRGGQSTLENCQLICGKCHSKHHGIVEI